MNTSRDGAIAMIAAYGALFNSGSLVGYDGAFPATPQTALSGNNAHVTAGLSASAFGSPAFASGYVSAAASFSAASFNPSSNGPITFFRGFKSDGTTPEGDFTVGSAWLPSTLATAGQFCTNGGNTYKCVTTGTTASSGGPTGTTAAITDGSAVWDYVGTVADTWQASHAYTATQAVIKGGNWYECVIAGTSAGSGGPSGTSADIVDGTVHWDYIGPAALFDVTMGNCNVQLGTPASFTWNLKMAVL